MARAASNSAVGGRKQELAFQFALVLSWALLPATLTYTASFVKAVFLPRYLASLQSDCCY